MTKPRSSEIDVAGFCISVGEAEGTVIFVNNPYQELQHSPSETVLLLSYPAITFIRLMHESCAVIAEMGTNKIEAATFLRQLDKPVLFGAGHLRDMITPGLRVKVAVRSDGSATVRFV